ncbi:MAG: T9SS type A sorting domain-containing protein [Bacteroidia bacterium]|nr:T9SS type A sorting domain-containing protein [Bacteroidia bacterium]
MKVFLVHLKVLAVLACFCFTAHSQCSFTTTTPYFESFQGITADDQLPNCGWSASNIGGSCKTYSAFSGAYNGQKCAAFYYVPAGTSYFYTNGIYLVAGINYSASCFYKTNYSGATNWTNLSILVGANQASVSLSPIASTNVATASSYLQLSGTFSVASSGIYYIAISGSCTNGSAEYLYFDNLSVGVLCTGVGAWQSPTVSIMSSNSQTQNVICSSSNQFTLSGTGADTYTWNYSVGGNITTTNNPIVIAVNSTLFPSGTYSVVGTNTLTGCTASAAVSAVHPAPTMTTSIQSSTVCPGQTVTLSISGTALSYTWGNGMNTSSIAISPSVSMTYSVTGTNNYGCTNTSSIFITVASPSVYAQSSSTILCLGSTATITGSGTTSYFWPSELSYINWVTVSPSVNTTYTLIGTNNPGCSDTTMITINVDTFPDLSLAGTTSVICLGESAVLTGAGAVSYQWQGSNLISSGNSATVNPSSSFIYSVTGTSSNGCSATRVFNVEVNECVGLFNYFKSTLDFGVSPNPNTGHFFIECDPASNTLFEIRDLRGRIIQRGLMISERTPIDMMSEPSGIYLLIIGSNNDSRAFKLIKTN